MVCKGNSRILSLYGLVSKDAHFPLVDNKYTHTQHWLIHLLAGKWLPPKRKHFMHYTGPGAVIIVSFPVKNEHYQLREPELAHRRHVKWLMGTRHLRTVQKWMWRLQMTPRHSEGGETKRWMHRLAKKGWRIWSLQRLTSSPVAPGPKCVLSLMCSMPDALRRGSHAEPELYSPSLPFRNERNQGK